MLWRPRPDPIEIKSLQAALAAVRLDLAAAIQAAVDLRSENGRLEDELANLSRRCEASELLAREIGEARDQLVAERDHTRHKVEALLAAAGTHYDTAVGISYEPKPAAPGSFSAFVEAVEVVGLTARFCSDNHWQILGGRQLVNVWPKTHRSVKEAIKLAQWQEDDEPGISIPFLNHPTQPRE